MPDLAAATVLALTTIRDNSIDLLGKLGDPLGITIESTTDLADAAESQGVATSTLTNMASMFGTQFAAFCYLVFVLLYAPCAAVLGTTAKEAGVKWMLLTFAWTTSLAYITSSCIYQLGTFFEHPLGSAIWLAGCAVAGSLFVFSLRSIGRKSVPTGLITVVQV